MRHERGQLAAWAYLALAIGLLAALAVAIMAWKSYTAALVRTGFEAGVAAERAKWQEREAKELAAANAKILELTAQVRARERAQADAIAKIDRDHQKELDDAQARNAGVLAALRAGTLVLRDPGTAAGQGACDGGGAETASGTGQRHAQARGQLSEQAAGFLLRLAGEADEVVADLTACQRIIEADRASVGASP